MRIWLSALLAVAVALAGCFDGDDELVDEDDPGGADSGIRGDTPAEPAGTDGGDGGAGDGETGAGDGDTGGSSDPDDPGDSSQETHEVVIRDLQYVDGTITVQAGDTVTWLHRDQSTKHTVTADDGSFDSGSESADFMDEFSYDEFSHTFDEAGQYAYHCKVHPSMTGTVTVQA